MNTLTGLIPTLFESLNRVSREMVGYIPAVTRDADAARAAVGQTVRTPIGQAGALEDVAPGQMPANSGATTVNYADITITKSKAAPILWTGEEQRGVGTTGVYNRVLADQFTDGMRKLVNAIESDLAIAAKVGASRAYGTAGTAPFGTASDLSDIASVRGILEANGAPLDDLQLALGSGALVNLRGKQSVLFKVNEAGSSDMLRDGMTDRLQGFALRNSAGIQVHTKGTGASYVLNGTPAFPSVPGTNNLVNLAVQTGTGTILPGDIVALQGDSAKYVVGLGGLSGGILPINAPGLLQAHAASDTVTVGNNYTPNAAFAKTAMVLVTRAPAVPEGGDSADDVMSLTDPLTGLTFEVRVYRQYRQVKFEIAIAWGVACVKPEHVALLIG